MELRQVKGNTWCLMGEVCIPLYKTDDTHCVLIDTGTAAQGEALDGALADHGLIPVGILGTHMHYDHHGNTQRLRRQGVPAALPEGEAALCRTAMALKNHLFVFSLSMVTHNRVLSGLIGPVDRLIGAEETGIRWCGAEFGILHTPGHSPDHICVITPDGVCCLGDALMSGDQLAHVRLPYAFDVGLDLAAKRSLAELDCPAYVLAHRGVETGPLGPLIEENLAAVERVLAVMEAQVTRPMLADEVFRAFYLALGLRTKHPIKAAHQERYARPLLEYLTVQRRVAIKAGEGMLWFCPREECV